MRELFPVHRASGGRPRDQPFHLVHGRAPEPFQLIAERARRMRCQEGARQVEKPTVRRQRFRIGDVEYGADPAATTSVDADVSWAGRGGGDCRVGPRPLARSRQGAETARASPDGAHDGVTPVTWHTIRKSGMGGVYGVRLSGWWMSRGRTAGTNAPFA